MGNPAALNVAEARADLGRLPILASSEGRPWRGIALDRFDGYTVENMISPPRDHPVITMCLAGSARVFQQRCGKSHDSAALPGEFTVMPSGYRTRWRGAVPRHLVMRIENETLSRAATDLREAGGTRFDMINGFRVNDPIMVHYGSLFDAELHRSVHPGQAVLVESLAAALVVHLVRQHTVATGVDDRPHLTAHSKHIRRALAYIEDCGHDRVGLVELAAVAGLSLYHFAREFRRQLGVPPAFYVEQRRIERAKHLLRAGTLPLSEVALAAGFADQSHFSRRFRAAVGCTPRAFALDHGKRGPD